MSQEQILQIVKLIGIPILNGLVGLIKKYVHFSPEQKDRWLPIITVILGMLGTVLTNALAGSGITLASGLEGAGYGAGATALYKVTHRTTA